jgi:hypothetical protein
MTQPPADWEPSGHSKRKGIRQACLPLAVRRLTKARLAQAKTLAATERDKAVQELIEWCRLCEELDVH